MRGGSYLRERRVDRLAEWKQQNLAFDLINAFVLANNARDVALLLHDLLTTKEIRNLTKRLGIAKMLLAGDKYDTITDQLNCSLGTVAKVKIWLDEGGEGLKRIILLLPKRTIKPKRAGGIPGYNLPQILWAGTKYIVATREKKRLEEFLNRMAEKGILDKNIREQLSEEFRASNASKK